MIILFNPRATRPRNRRSPLAILALAAVLEGREEYEIVDGNLDDKPDRHHSRAHRQNITLNSSACPSCPARRWSRQWKPPVRSADFIPTSKSYGEDTSPPSIPTQRSMRNTSTTSFAGQGEDTLLEFLDAMRGKRSFDSILGLSYKDSFGLHRNNAERPMRGPDEFPWSSLPSHPCRKISASVLLRQAHCRAPRQHRMPVQLQLLRRSCSLRQRRKNGVARSAPPPILTHLVTKYGADSVQFYDMNFFLREDQHANSWSGIAHLNLRWWCEARVDIMSRYSDETMPRIKRAGCTMIFFGAESGSDWALKEMQKGITTDQTRHHGRADKEIRHHPRVLLRHRQSRTTPNATHARPSVHSQTQKDQPRLRDHHHHYTPMPQRGNMYGEIDGQITFPSTPAEWATKEWMDFTLRIDTQAPWLKRKTKALIDNFEIVVGSRWPTVQDILAPQWSRDAVCKTLSSWRYALRIYRFPVELQMGQSVHQSAQTEAGESMTTMMAAPSDVFGNWAEVYDEQPNPLLSLEQRFLNRMLPDAAGLDVLDAGCGTGRWLQHLAVQHPASLIGVDSSAPMLQHASAKLGTAATLRLGSCLALPAQNATADLVLASFVLSYLEDVKVFCSRNSSNHAARCHRLSYGHAS